MAYYLLGFVRRKRTKEEEEKRKLQEASFDEADMCGDDETGRE